MVVDRERRQTIQVTLNSHSLFYHEQGDPQGAPILFLHGFPFSHEMWTPQLRAMPERFHVIAPDIRGHGASDMGDGQYSLEFFVDDLFALMDHLALPSVTLCGLSMGGYIALRARERQPQRVRALVLCDTRSEADSNEARLRRTAIVRTVKTEGVEAFAEEFLPLIFAPHSFRDHPEAVALCRRLICANAPFGISGTAIALGLRTDTTASLSSISEPTLILVGEQDMLTPPDVSEAMHNRIARSEYHVIPCAAHMSNLENPEEFNRQLLRFLESLGRQG